MIQFNKNTSLFLLLLTIINIMPQYAVDFLNLEKPQYEVVQKFDTFEVRNYKPYLVAQVQVEGRFKEAGNKAFKLLAGYIFGKNRSVIKPEAGNEKMKMTAPVNMMEIPDTQDKYYVQFFMPTKYTKDTLPIPDDSRVKIELMPGGLTAALKYSGTWSRRRYLRKKVSLKKAIIEKGFLAQGNAIFARYNSPFSLWFMRRNEVLIPIKNSDRFPTR
tara:strand:+ start:2334 stop:2981 length:648 start_codon:yes stop_codon:yes gene_type:complete